MARRTARLFARLPATLSLCAATAVAFLLEIALGGPTDLAAQVRLGALQTARVAEHHEAFRLLAPAFLHHGWLHFALVELLLLQLGALVESVWGGRRLLVAWTWSAVAASLASASLSDLANLASVGGSGAAMGLAGLLLGTAWFGDEPTRGFLAEAVARRVGRVVLLTFLLGLAALFLFPVTDNWGHLGGLLCGVALSLTLPADRSERVWIGPIASLTGVVLAATVGWTALSGDDALPTLHHDAARALAVRLSEEADDWISADLVVEMLDHHERAGALDEGLEVVERAVRRTHEPAVVGRVAALLTASAEGGRPWDRHAHVAIERWLALAPADPHVLNLAAWRLVTRGDAERRDPVRAEELSRESLARAVSLGEDDQRTARAAFLDTLAEALYQQGRYAEAADAQRESVALARELELDSLDVMSARLDRIELALGSG